MVTKKTLLKVKEYLDRQERKYSLLKKQTGDNWLSPLSYTVYLWVEKMDQELDAVLKRGFYKNTYILGSVGGNKYLRNAQDIEQLKAKASEMYKKYKKWLQVD